jgi:mannose-1-phosphate guanylyltransferase/mannose-6-phosphate isomerase
MSIQPVILSGGAGTRLWPLSRQKLPKQFLKLNSSHTLLQETVLRPAAMQGVKPPVVVCNQEHRRLVESQLREVGCAPAAILLEPVGRNTAPAVTAAALWALESAPDAILLVLPSDHLVRNSEAFLAAVSGALPEAERGAIIAFGIVPAWPETGYGYIQRGEPVDAARGVFRIARFIEKPALPRAVELMREGDCLWNSGMFLFRADAFLAEVGQYCPDILNGCRSALENAFHDGPFVALDEEAFLSCSAQSIDYGVMEHTRHGAVLSVDLGWSDVGTWAALWQASPKDDKGNNVTGSVFLEGVTGSLISAQHRLVAAVGLNDVVIVETPDAVLVSMRESSQKVKDVVASMDQAGGPVQAASDRVSRPWGYYESVMNSDGYQVKRLTVDPGQRISLQRHRCRSEHWVVVQGTARVTLDEAVMDLGVNQSVFILAGQRHRLENPGDQPLKVIEVQVGDYLGEDDIERFADDYARA